MNTHSHAVYCHIKKCSFQMYMFGSCFGMLAVILASDFFFFFFFFSSFSLHLKDFGRFLAFQALSLYLVRPATRKASAIRSGVLLLFSVCGVVFKLPQCFHCSPLLVFLRDFIGGCCSAIVT